MKIQAEMIKTFYAKLTNQEMLDVHSVERLMGCNLDEIIDKLK